MRHPPATSGSVDKCADSVENRRALWTSGARGAVSACGSVESAARRCGARDVPGPGRPPSVPAGSTGSDERVHRRHRAVHRPAVQAATLGVHTVHTMMMVMTE